MADSLWTLTLAEFRARTASALPTPGGGSVCAVSASLGLGLVIMALEITRKRADHEGLAALVERARSLLDELGQAADDDACVFEEYMRAHELPQRTEQEAAARTEALRQAAARASEVPMRAADCAVRALELAGDAAEIARAHVISDVLAGAALLHAATHGLFATLAMNLSALERDVSERLVAARLDLTQRMESAIQRVRERADGRAAANVMAR